MSFYDLARARYSVRKFDGRPVEEEKLNQILEVSLFRQFFDVRLN